MRHLLMSWCVWIFPHGPACVCLCVFAPLLPAARTHPVAYFFHASLSLRWDEFGQTGRGSESAAATGRGRRVSFTASSKQQRNFREFKQRVFRGRAGRYTVRSLLLTLLDLCRHVLGCQSCYVSMSTERPFLQQNAPGQALRLLRRITARKESRFGVFTFHLCVFIGLSAPIT